MRFISFCDTRAVRWIKFDEWTTPKQSEHYRHMRSFLRRFASPREGTGDGRVSSMASWGVTAASDPTTWTEAFSSHWEQAQYIMRSTERSTIMVEEHVLSVFKHFEQMAFLLLTEINSQPVPSIGPIMDRFFMEEIMTQVVQFAMRSPPHCVQLCQVNLLKLYENLVTQSHTHHSLLVHKPILMPLLRLLEWCNRTTLCSGRTAIRNASAGEVEKHFVLLLYQVCIKISEHSTLLEFFFNTTLQNESEVLGTELSPRDLLYRNMEEAPRFLVFTLLIAYLYEQGDIGQLARDAILLILSVSRDSPLVATFISEHCEFCAVLATGLSGCFSQLPRRLPSTLGVSDDWHKITTTDIEAHQALAEFHAALLFVNATVQMFQVGHRQVLDQLLGFIYNGFLLSVVRPALFENGLEELTSATAYLELCFRTITEPALLRTFIRFIIVESENEQRILDALVQRIGSSTKLCLVTLALFDTLLSLYCEDLMVELVLKYLIPCTHVMGSQVANVSELDMTAKATNKLLSLVPRCCPLDYHLNLSSSASDLSTSQDDPLGSDLSTANNQMSTFYDYLDSARTKVQDSYLGTRCWTFPYDGRNPDPYNFRESSESCSPSEAESGAFKRLGSLRQSRNRVNAYFTRRHTSMLTTSGVEPSAVDLSVLGPEFMTFSDDDLDYIDRLLLKQDASDSEANGPGTPRYKKEAPDYFKLNFEEDESSDDGSKRSQKTTPVSSDGGQMMPEPPSRTANVASPVLSDGYQTDSTPYVLQGWNQLQDLDAFIDTLGTVRASHDSSKFTLDENIAFLEERLARMEDKTTDSALGDSVTASQSQHNDSDNKEQMSSSMLSNSENSELRMGIPIECAQSIIQPCLGPFLTCLLAKLDSFLDNGLYLNLQLTGVLCRLACFPQPLVTSLFFNPTLVLQPSVKSIWQILSATSQKIDALAFAADGFSLLLQRGWKHMLTRDKRYLKELGKAMKPRNVTSSPKTVLEDQGFTDIDRERSLSDIFATSEARRAPALGKQSRADSDTSGVTQRPRFQLHRSFADSQSATLDTMRTKNVVYCAIVMREFMHELAAISLEQTAVRGYIDVTKYL